MSSSESQASVAVVVAVRNRRETTLRFLKRFESVTYRDYSIIMVDDGSTDGTAERVQAEFPDVTVLHGDGDLWWTGATDLGARYAVDQGFSYVLTINDDCSFEFDFLSKLVESAVAHPNSIIGVCVLDEHERELVYSAGTAIHFGGGKFLRQQHQGENHAEIARKRLVSADALTGCGVLVPVSCFASVGFYEVAALPHYHGDSEFVFRAKRAGHGVYVDTAAKVWFDRTPTRTLTLFEVLFSRKSTFRIQSIWAFHRRHCPFYLIPWSIFRHYARFASGLWIIFKRAIGRQP